MVAWPASTKKKHINLSIVLACLHDFEIMIWGDPTSLFNDIPSSALVFSRSTLFPTTLYTTAWLLFTGFKDIDLVEVRVSRGLFPPKRYMELNGGYRYIEHETREAMDTLNIKQRLWIHCT